MARASAIVLSWKQLSRPGTPWVLDTEPTAITSLSYLEKAIEFDETLEIKLATARYIDIPGFSADGGGLNFK